MDNSDQFYLDEDLLEKLANQNGMSKDQFKKNCEGSGQAFDYAVRNRKNGPTLLTLRRMADALDMDLLDFLRGSLPYYANQESLPNVPTSPTSPPPEPIATPKYHGRNSRILIGCLFLTTCISIIFGTLYIVEQRKQNRIKSEAYSALDLLGVSRNVLLYSEVEDGSKSQVIIHQKPVDEYASIFDLQIALNNAEIIQKHLKDYCNNGRNFSWGEMASYFGKLGIDSIIVNNYSSGMQRSRRASSSLSIIGSDVNFTLDMQSYLPEPSYIFTTSTKMPNYIPLEIDNTKSQIGVYSQNRTSELLALGLPDSTVVSMGYLKVTINNAERDAIVIQKLRPVDLRKEKYQREFGKYVANAKVIRNFIQNRLISFGKMQESFAFSLISNPDIMTIVIHDKEQTWTDKSEWALYCTNRNNPPQKILEHNIPEGRLYRISDVIELITPLTHLQIYHDVKKETPNIKQILKIGG